MIVVKIELWPSDGGPKKVLHVGRISNTGTGTKTRGNYKAVLFKRGTPWVWKDGAVEGFPRLRLGAWDLLYRVLHQIVGDRSRPPRTKGKGQP